MTPTNARQFAKQLNTQFRDQLTAFANIFRRVPPSTQTAEVKVRARLIDYDEVGESEGGVAKIVLCINEEAHLIFKHEWHDSYRKWQPGDNTEDSERNFVDITINRHSASVVRCDCHDFREIEMLEHHAQLVQEFLQTGKTVESEFEWEGNLIGDPQPWKYRTQLWPTDEATRQVGNPQLEQGEQS